MYTQRNVHEIQRNNGEAYNNAVESTNVPHNQRESEDCRNPGKPTTKSERTVQAGEQATNKTNDEIQRECKTKRT